MLQFTLRFHFHLPLPFTFILLSVLVAFCKTFALPSRILFTLSRTAAATATAVEAEAAVAATTTITLRNLTQLDCHGNFRFRRRLFGSQR